MLRNKGGLCIGDDIYGGAFCKHVAGCRSIP